MHVWVVGNTRSISSRSIYHGFANGFRQLKHDVRFLDTKEVKTPGFGAQLPELLWVVHGGDLPTDMVMAYRQHGIVTALYLVDDPYEVDRSTTWARYYDWVFTCDRSTVQVHEAYSKAAFLPLAYDSTIFQPSGERINTQILLFGMMNPVRQKVVGLLYEEFGHYMTFLGHQWPHYGNKGEYIRKKLVEPEEYAKYYRGAEIVLDIKRDSVWSPFGDCNVHGYQATMMSPRCWEVPACGGFLLGEFRHDMTSYTPAVQSFVSLDELQKKLRYYLSHPEERDKVAARVAEQIAPHTYKARALTALRCMGLVAEELPDPNAGKVHRTKFKHP